MTWVDEFGADWAVPDEIAKAEGIDDLSWHNDVAPTFGKYVAEHGQPCAHVLRIWVDHVDPNESGWGERPPSVPRYWISYESDDPVDGIDTVDTMDDVWAGDDPVEAVAWFVDTLVELRRKVAAR
jgi:hypothetical protein